ncbi:MAG: alpha/beta hydrolase [Chitinophagaceae bacterium]|nr:alpha/beta hydrolase [Chitinophagaceae bacterium]
MKLKLSQKLLLRYYTAQLKAIALVSPKKAAEKAFALFCTPYSGRTVKTIPEIFSKAEAISFRSQDLNIHGFRFRPSESNGKKVLILHGFSSNAYKFDKYINPLLKDGFEIVLFDAPGHGRSEGKMINALIYKKVILAAEKKFGPFDGIMGHSLGGLAGSLAFEELPNHEKRRLALVAPATETTTAIDNFFRMVTLDDKTRQAFMQLITDIGNKDVHYYSVSRVIKQLDSPVLWVHDKQDTICPYKDVKPLLKLNLPHVRFMITEQLGHSRIYKDAAVCREIVGFFKLLH